MNMEDEDQIIDEVGKQNLLLNALRCIALAFVVIGFLVAGIGGL